MLSVKQEYIDEKLILEDQQGLQIQKLHPMSPRSEQPQSELQQPSSERQEQSKSIDEHPNLLFSIEECKDGLDPVVSSMQTLDLK